MKFMLFAGTSNPELARGIAKVMRRKLGRLRIKRYEDGEFNIRILDDVKSSNIFLIQGTSHPIHDNFFELIVTADALKKSGAKNVIAVMPYFGYQRQEKRDLPGKGIAGQAVVKMLESAGIDGVICVDIHSFSIVDYFTVKTVGVDPLDFMLKRAFKAKKMVVISPDLGAVHRATHASASFGEEVAIVEKKRMPKTGAIRVKHLAGSVSGKTVLIVDDMVTTGATLLAAAKLAKEGGAKKIYALVTHGVLAGEALSKINSSHIEKIFFSNTLKIRRSKKIRVIDISPVIAEKIRKFDVQR